jgi:hypothetical protein
MKLEAFPSGRPTDFMLCEYITLLVKLKIDQSEGRKVAKS